ncbi:MAG: hypothetical protein HUK18_05270 [Bacteroidales bacterium]|nr:hypothetical protein [Bacteroidales bacterium]
MKYIPSINIEYGIDADFEYLVTPNAEAVTGSMVASFHSGIHSFSIIGTYGTGKSSYLMALERDLMQGTSLLVKNKSVFGDFKGFDCLNILGDYQSLSNLLSDKLGCGRSDDNKNIFTFLTNRYNAAKKEGKMMFIVIDEFGKVLEHAAKNNPEKELYFLQRLAEFVNVPTRNIILLTTLHQNFGAYAYKLSESQKSEWTKVKGRYKELVFSEPVEQLLYLASEQIASSKVKKDRASIKELLSFAQKTKFVSESLKVETVENLYPLDAFSAMAITKAIQKYGQNERTLFSFLTAQGDGTLSAFTPKTKETYNLSYVYDYLIYNFYTALSEVNADSTNWTAMRVALERVGSGTIKPEYIVDAEKLVKTIGLLNLFGTASTSISKELLIYYSKEALNIADTSKILDILSAQKIIRYAAYKSSYILFEGTDIDIEDELYKAGSIVPVPNANVADLLPYINQKAVAVSEEYYINGTPRYFEFVARNEPEVMKPQGEIDGYIQMIFPLENGIMAQTSRMSSECDSAILFVVFNNVEDICKHLYEIQKLNYLLDNVVLEDRVAKREVQNLVRHEQALLNKAINDSLISDLDNTTWFFKGEALPVKNYRAFNKLLSRVCHEIYPDTPILRNELFNRQKLSSAISLARVKLLDAMLDYSDKEDFGFDKTTCPPEKAIYYTIFKNTGIHRRDEHGIYVLGAPQNDSIKGLWDACESFVKSTTEKPRRVSELIKVLRSQPLKLKQGVIDFWLPIYLYIKQQDFAMYTANGSFVMNVNREVFELLQKKPADFSIKAFNVSGVKVEFFKKYRLFLRKESDTQLTSASFLETFKPFLQFYRSLNEYAKHTRKFENSTTAKFRDVLANAKDPEKAFFEDLPEALGYKETSLTKSNDFVEQYLSLIKQAVHELNVCYDNLIDRIESSVIDKMSLPVDYDEYKRILENRYKGVKKHLLTTKCRTFFDRVLAVSESKKEFYEKIANVILDRKLSQMQDREEEHLIDNLIFLFQELDRYVSISSVENEKDEVFNFEIASNKKHISRSQTYRLPEKQLGKANEIKKSIDALLTGDKNLDVCVLLKVLNEKLS